MLSFVNLQSSKHCFSMQFFWFFTHLVRKLQLLYETTSTKNGKGEALSKKRYQAVNHSADTFQWWWENNSFNIVWYLIRIWQNQVAFLSPFHQIHYALGSFKFDLAFVCIREQICTKKSYSRGKDFFIQWMEFVKYH